jgi:ectoine hydroxylase-related dioxygenase (phytanoyl-CoA dioxygenase family)
MSARAESQRASFEQRGWCILRQFMPPASLAALKAALGEYMTGLELGDIKADGRHVKWAADGSRSRPQLLVNMVEIELLPPDEMRRWLEVGWALLGEECRIMTNEATGSRLQYFDKPQGVSEPTPPHQDQFYFNVLPARALTMWLALDPVDTTNGCLQYVSGSHLGHRTRPHVGTTIKGMSSMVEWSPDDELNAEDIILAPGDLCCHHVCTVHRASANNDAAGDGGGGGAHRRAFSLVVQGLSTGRDEAAHNRMRARENPALRVSQAPGQQAKL